MFILFLAHIRGQSHSDRTHSSTNIPPPIALLNHPLTASHPSPHMSTSAHSSLPLTPTSRTQSLPEVIQNPSAPPAIEQKAIIEAVESECTCTYAVSKTWYKRWQAYMGVVGTGVGVANPPATGEYNTYGEEVPGPVEMDIANDSQNEYVAEDIWKKLVLWYGVQRTHQLDRYSVHSQ